MSKIDYQALREKAEKATKGSYIVGHTSVNQHGNLTGVFVCQKWKGEPGGVIAECHVNCLVETDAQAYANAEFIAEVNPATMLALLDEREAQNKCIAELEKIATDYALKFQKAQDALKHVVLMRKSEQEAADNNLIDSECHVAELEEALRDKQALLEASEKRIAELEAELVSQTYKLNEMSGNSPVTPSVWMSCSERMPDDAQWCVVEAADGYYVQCWSEGQGWLGDDISLRNCDVIRWMTIPEPPEQDGE